MKSSEEMTEYVIKRLNEHREKVNRRNAFIKKITFGLVDIEQKNTLTEKFTDSEEVKGVGFMNRKFSLIFTTSSVFLAMAVIISIISPNMRKPDLNNESEMSQSFLISTTNAENSTETSDKSNSVQIVPVKTTVAPESHAGKKVETAKTTSLVRSMQPTAVGKTGSDKAEEQVQAEEPIQPTEAGKTENNKADEPVQTEEPIQTTEAKKTEIPQTKKPAQTEKPVQTTISPAADENIEVFQLTQSTDGVEEFMELFREKYGNDGQGNCYNVTPQEITDKYGMRIFKFDYDCDGFLLYENEIYHIGESFGGWGLISFAVADIDHNGSNELYFTFSFGSGRHRSNIAYFDTQSKEIAEFDYVYWDHDMVLSNKNGMLSICQSLCHAEEEFAVFTAGEEIGRIEFIDGEIQLALIEN